MDGKWIASILQVRTPVKHSFITVRNFEWIDGAIFGCLNYKGIV